MGPQLVETHETPPSLGDEGLLFLRGLESNPESSLQIQQETCLPLGHAVGSMRFPSQLERRAESLLPFEMRPDFPGESGIQPRNPCRPWRGILSPGHKPI